MSGSVGRAIGLELDVHRDFCEVAIWESGAVRSAGRINTARREQLVRSRSRAKNEIHAVLMRRLKGRPTVSDLFGVKGRKWLGELELPVEEPETVQSAMRHLEFLGDLSVEELDGLGSRELHRACTRPSCRFQGVGR